MQIPRVNVEQRLREQLSSKASCALPGNDAVPSPMAFAGVTQLHEKTEGVLEMAEKRVPTNKHSGKRHVWLVTCLWLEFCR